ncbi:MAG: glycosyltransferase family 4 protein [Thermoguttaceae bacterium]
MKVLWTSNVLLPAAAEAMARTPGRGGSWMAALADELERRCPQVELGVVTMQPCSSVTRRVVGNVVYYVVPSRLRDPLGRPRKPVLRAFRDVIADFQPTLIHVHGSEYSYGRIASEVAPETPTVVEIQGLIAACEKCHWGGMKLTELIRYRTFRDWLRLDGLLEQRWKLRRRARQESDILCQARHIIGRTAWDRTSAFALAPNAAYYHCDEMLRPPFFSLAWQTAGATKHTILATSTVCPNKGFHLLLTAVHSLKRDFPNIQVRVAGSTFKRQGDRPSIGERLRMPGYSRYLTDRIRQYGLEQNIVPLGWLDAEQMAAELTRAHVYVLPSFIENSPNALAEAMLVGTPCVAARVGGVPSMAQDETEALLFPRGDAERLAGHIRRLFLDDGLAQTLSNNARRTALVRHAPETVVRNLLGIYETVTNRRQVPAANPRDFSSPSNVGRAA